MYLIYNFFLIALSIIFLPVILLAFILKPKLRAGFWQKLGFYKLDKTKLKKDQTIWIHAVSVGEVNAVERFVKQAFEKFPNHNIILSTVTRTGQAVANSKLADFTDQIIYFPYDFIFSIKSALNAIKPDVIIIAETEIWPNFTNEVNNKKIPLLIINGRISPGSYKGYKKLPFFFQRILSCYSLILMQTTDDRKRIIDIGAPAAITKVMGNLKFDIANQYPDSELKKLKNDLKTENYKILIAGSTHAGEDEIILSVFKRLKQEFNELRLLIAPRHPERNANVYSLVQQTTRRPGLRSQMANFENADIIMLDTMGELGKLYSVCDVAFIGGSFSETGGHNPLEAAIFNKPTLSGPTVFNFKDIYRFLTEAKASKLVENEEKLYNELRKLLSDKIAYTQAAEACKIVFEKNSGALEFAINELKKITEE